MSSATVNVSHGDKPQSAFSAVVRKSYSSFSVDSILGGASPSAESHIPSKEDAATPLEEDFRPEEDFRREGEVFSSEDHYRGDHHFQRNVRDPEGGFIGHREREGAEGENDDNDSTVGGGGGGDVGGGSGDFILRGNNIPGAPKYLSMHAESAFRIATSAAQAYNLLQERLNRSPGLDKEGRISTDRPPSPSSPGCEDEDESEDVHVDTDDQDEKGRTDPQQPQTVLRPTALGPIQEPRFPGMPPPSLLGHIPQHGLWPSLPFLHQQLSLRSLNSECKGNAFLD